MGATARAARERLGLDLPRQLAPPDRRRDARQPAVRARARPHARGAAGRSRPGEDLPVPDAVEELLGTRVARLPAAGRAGCCSPSRSAASCALSQLDRNRGDGRARGRGGRRRGRRRRRARPRRPIRCSRPRRASARARATGASSTCALAEVGGGRGAPRRSTWRSPPSCPTPSSRPRSAPLPRARPRAARRGGRRRAGRARVPADAGRAPRAHRARARARPATSRPRASATRRPICSRPSSTSLPGGPRARRARTCSSQRGAVTDNDEIQATSSARSLRARDRRAMRAHPCSPRWPRTSRPFASSGCRRPRRWALEALRASRRAGPDAERVALYALAWTRSMRGNPIDDLCERFRAASDDAVLHRAIARADRGSAARLAGGDRTRRERR